MYNTPMVAPKTEPTPNREPQIELWMDNWAWAPLPAVVGGGSASELDREKFLESVKTAYNPEVCAETLQLNASLEVESPSPKE